MKQKMETQEIRQVILTLSVALLAGLLLSRLAKLLKLPAVTAYLVAGLILGPFCFGAFGLEGFGFNSLEQVDSLKVITQTALGFIAFTIGNEFRLSQLKTFGKKAITIGILQAVITTLLVDVVLIVLHICFPNVITVPCAIVLGAIASATAADTAPTVSNNSAGTPRILFLTSLQ